ncbi:MAG TPA: PAS domain-containing sensor histidine kinase [Candidatus Binatia bacterium]|nr:PAS domain-containing sensor histidine kinase [Candidatus Binatia bacterium]
MSQCSAGELLEAIPDAVVGVDGEGRIAFVNGQAERMFGYHRSAMLGRPVELLLPDRLGPAHVRHRASYQANPTTRPMGAGLYLLARRRDGSEFPVEISLSPFADGDGVRIIGVVRDVTQRCEIERERERLLAIAERARSEAEEALRLRAEAERLRDDLSTMLVHDLKSPVNGIAMTVHLLLRRGHLSDAQRQSLERVGRMCRELLRLAGNILEIAKIEAGEMPVANEPVAIADLIDEVATEYGPMAEEVDRRIDVAIGADLPPVVADRGLLKRVLVNLLVNALRHSGSRDVRVEAASAPGPQVAIRVVDHGHGIPAAAQTGIFEKFRTVRGDPTADTGLGLPFCKLAVERMGGRITVHSAPGRGAEFAVLFQAGADSTSRAQGARILRGD